MNRYRNHDKRLSAAKKMPPLRKRKPGEEYSVQRDQVLDWVQHNDDLAAYLVSVLVRIGYIVYDQDAGTWRGADYET